MSSASMHSTPTTHTPNSTSSHPRQSPSHPPAQPPSLQHRNQLTNSSSSSHNHHHRHQDTHWYSRAHDLDHPDPPAPEHSSPAQNATFASDHHHHSHSTQAYRSNNYQAYSPPQADRFYPPQSAAPRHLPTSPHSDSTKQEGSLNRTSTLANPSVRTLYTSPQLAQTRSDVAVNTEQAGAPGQRHPAHPSPFDDDDTYYARETYESPLTHARREVHDGYDLPPHPYYSTPRSHREPNNTLFRTPADSTSSASASYTHPPPSSSSASFPPPSYPHHHSSRFIPDDSPGGQSRYGHPTSPEVPVGLPASASAAAASSSTALRQHLPPLSESFGSSFPRHSGDMNLRPDGLGPSPMPLAPSPLDPHGYPTAINTGPGSYPYDHPFDYDREGSPDLVSPGGDSNQASPMRSPAKRGKKVEMACHFCRGRKLKCDGMQPRCQHCSRRGQICTWDSHVRRRGPGLKNKSKDVKGGVSKRRESVSTTSAGRSTSSPRTPARRSLDDLVSAYRGGPAEALTPDGECLPFFHSSVKGEDVDGDVPMTTGTNPPFAPPYPPTNEYTQAPSTPQDPYHYPGHQQTQYGPPSPPIRRVIPMSRTPSSSLAGAMGTDPNYSAYPSDNNQGSQEDSAWRRHSIAGGQCGNPSAYISETTGGGAPIAGAGTTSSSASAAYHWDRDNAGGNGPSSYAYPSPSAPAQYFNGQAVHGYPQQQQQQYHTPSSPPSMGYGQQQQYAQPRGYATSRDHHHQQQHQHQPQVSPPMPGYEEGWFAHAGGPGQAWAGHVGHASADLSSGGDSVAHDPHHERLHDPSSSFTEIRARGSPSQETDPSSYRAGRSPSGTVSSSSSHSSPAQVAHNLYHLHPISTTATTTTTTAAVVDMRNRPAPPAMQTSSSVDNDLAESLINLAHGPPATGMVRRVSSVTANSGSESGGTAVPMAESYTMASTTSTDSARHQRTSSSDEGSWAEGRSVPRANNPATTVGHAPAIGSKNAFGTNSPHSGHEVAY